MVSKGRLWLGRLTKEKKESLGREGEEVELSAFLALSEHVFFAIILPLRRIRSETRQAKHAIRLGSRVVDFNQNQPPPQNSPDISPLKLLSRENLELSLDSKTYTSPRLYISHIPKPSSQLNCFCIAKLSFKDPAKAHMLIHARPSTTRPTSNPIHDVVVPAEKV
jgi:hypothetical protein